MTILHIATSLDGGAGIGLDRYHRALLGQGVDSRILVCNPPPDRDGRVERIPRGHASLPLRIARRFGLVQPPHTRMTRALEALNRRPGAAGYELFSPPYSDLCPEEHPWIAEADVINLHWVAGCLDWPRFFAKVNKPVVLTLHDQQPYLGGFHYALDVENNPRLAPIEAKAREVKQRALHGHRIAVVANSGWNAAQARDSGFFPAHVAMETVYYPLDTEVFQPRSKDAAKTAFGVTPGHQVIGFACENLGNQRKGFSELIEAVGLLPAALRDRVTLLSFGRPPSRKISGLSILPWVHLGFLNTDVAKAAAYAAMDVFVAPSRAEAFGLTALEAQATGTPVVATPVGGLVEAVASPSSDSADGTTATLSPAALRDGVVALLTDDSLRARRAEAGRRLAVERHSPVVIGAQLAAFHRQLLGHGPDAHATQTPA